MFGFLTLAMALQAQSPEMRDYGSAVSMMVEHASCAGLARHALMEEALDMHVDRAGSLLEEVSTLAEQLEGRPELSSSPWLDLSYEAQSGIFVGMAYGVAQLRVSNEFQSLREESPELEFYEVSTEIALRLYNENGCSDVLSGNAQ